MAGTLTRLQMQNEVLDNLSRSSSLTLRSGTNLGTRVVTWLDRASIWITRYEDLLFCESTSSTVASQQRYAFPSNIRSLFGIRLENGLDSVKLTCIMPWEFDALVPKPNSNTTGRSDFYVPYKTTNTFELFRIPDAVYTLRMRYSHWPAALSSDTSVSDYTYMDDVIIYKATEYGYKWLQELEDAEVWKKDAQEALKEAVNAERTAFPDWEPVARGFRASVMGPGEYYNNPFIVRDP